MDYERIDKPLQGGGGGGGGLSPGKLRSLLLGLEKGRKGKDELETRFSMRSEADEVDSHRVSTSENCRDVDIVTTTTTADTMITSRAKEQHQRGVRLSELAESSGESDGGGGAGVSAFEFQRSERAPPSHRPPFSKPAPSKWDDAQKWIASPTSNRGKAGQAQPRKSGFLGYGGGRTKVVVEVPLEQETFGVEEVDTKRIDSSQAKKEVGGTKSANWGSQGHPVADVIGNSDSEVCLSRHDSSMHTATTFMPPPSTVRSVSMRDMGTEMTPIASQEPSRTGTPVRASSPIRSSISSRPSSPGRAAPCSTPIESASCQVEPEKRELSEKELQLKTRREIVALGTQLGKMNIAAWASKEEEDKDASVSLKTVPASQPGKSMIEIRAAAWEEAEKAKYMARFKREEIKIQAWENHQKAKTDAEMRKIEVEVERMRGRAQDKLMSKLAAAQHKAEEKRAAAEAKRNQQAARTAEQAEYIRRTGRIPSSFHCFHRWCWCFRWCS
ncbi:hypothetical protein QJS10_CPB15g00111 [Acorus calamus]|uniref:Remorin C-terminal domain-containing protein n=1 Tax=Acorus calamus TaxID=4465 RepID=A0AAV9D5V6_ACOCL|nr:hypothetical protein QJS10_CPB15g00111 [Acorus calamus]